MSRFSKCGTFALMLVVAVACGKKKENTAQPTPAGTAKFVTSVRWGTSLSNNVGGAGIDAAKNCLQWMEYTNGATKTQTLEIHANESGAACPTTQLSTKAAFSFTIEETTPQSFMKAYFLKAKSNAGALVNVGYLQTNTSAGAGFTSLLDICQLSGGESSDYEGACYISSDNDSGPINFFSLN